MTNPKDSVREGSLIPDRARTKESIKCRCGNEIYLPHTSADPELWECKKNLAKEVGRLMRENAELRDERDIARETICVQCKPSKEKVVDLNYEIAELKQAITEAEEKGAKAERERIRDIVLDDVPHKYQKRLLEVLNV